MATITAATAMATQTQRRATARCEETATARSTALLKATSMVPVQTLVNRLANCSPLRALLRLLLSMRQRPGNALLALMHCEKVLRLQLLLPLPLPLPVGICVAAGSLMSAGNLMPSIIILIAVTTVQLQLLWARPWTLALAARRPRQLQKCAIRRLLLLLLSLVLPL